MVVEDFQLFRRFVCSKLEQRSELRVVCEVSDGLEAVQKAEELKPDLILLDIGLPTLNGIEAARRIRDLVPESKIIFASQETSTEIVQAAMRLGAWGYVFKTYAEGDLLLAIDAVLSGKQFVSCAYATYNSETLSRLNWTKGCCTGRQNEHEHCPIQTKRDEAGALKGLLCREIQAAAIGWRDLRTIPSDPNHIFCLNTSL
jgi:DNA-binding NarL/FixJ family response regulator